MSKEDVELRLEQLNQALQSARHFPLEREKKLGDAWHILEGLFSRQEEVSAFTSVEKLRAAASMIELRDVRAAHEQVERALDALRREVPTSTVRAEKRAGRRPLTIKRMRE